MKRIWIFVFALAGCTVDVQTPPPEITVQCIVIELPGGTTYTECPDGGPDAEYLGQ